MFMSLITQRRSVRKFLDKQVEREKIDTLVEAVLRSPSSMGKNPWEFVVVTKPDLLEKLSKSKPHGAAFLKNAPLAFVVCADPSISDVWVEDASIASIYLHLAAESLGLGGCWIQLRERMHDQSKTAGEYAAEVLGIPRGMRVESIVAIGYPDGKMPPHGKEELLYEKVHDEAYGSPHRR